MYIAYLVVLSLGSLVLTVGALGWVALMVFDFVTPGEATGALSWTIWAATAILSLVTTIRWDIISIAMTAKAVGLA